MWDTGPARCAPERRPCSFRTGPPPPDATRSPLRAALQRRLLCERRSIDQSDRELHFATIGHQGRDLPRVGQAVSLVIEDRRTVGIVDRNIEIRSIEEIEDLEAQLHLHA